MKRLIVLLTVFLLSFVLISRTHAGYGTGKYVTGNKTEFDKLEKLGVTLSEYTDYLNYRVIYVGDTGDDVLKIKEMLYILGYYNTDKFSNVYTNDTMDKILKWRDDINSTNSGGLSPAEQLYMVIQCKNLPISYENLDYDRVARNPSYYEGTYYKFRAYIVQQIDDETSENVAFLASINNDGRKMVCCTANGFSSWEWDGDYENIGISTLLDGDIIEVKGELKGSISYTTVDGATVNALLFDIISMKVYER